MRVERVFFIQFSIDWKSIKLNDDLKRAHTHNRWLLGCWFGFCDLFLFFVVWILLWISGVKNWSGCFWRLTKLNCAICFQYLAILYLIQSVNWLQWLLHIDCFFTVVVYYYSVRFDDAMPYSCYRFSTVLVYFCCRLGCSFYVSVCVCVHACTNALDIYVNILNHIVKYLLLFGCAKQKKKNRHTSTDMLGKHKPYSMHTSRPTHTITPINVGLAGKYTTIISKIIRKEKRTNIGSIISSLSNSFDGFEICCCFFFCFSSDQSPSISLGCMMIMMMLIVLSHERLDRFAYASPWTIYEAISAYILTRAAIQIGAFDTNMRACAFSESKQLPLLCCCCFFFHWPIFTAATLGKGARTTFAWLLVKSTRAQIQ